MKSVSAKFIPDCAMHPGRVPLLFFILLLALALLPLAAAAQVNPAASAANPTQPGVAAGGGAGSSLGSSTEANAQRSVVVRVFVARDTPLKQQAFVRLYAANSGAALRDGVTGSDGTIAFANVPVGSYAAEVSAAGYRSQRKEFAISDAGLGSTQVDITLASAATQTADPLSRAPGLPGKARQHIDKGLVALRAGDLKKAHKEFTSAYNAAPRHAATNYMLGVVCLQMNELDEAERFFANAVSLQPGNVPALIGLGHARFKRGDLKGSAKTLQEAVSLAPGQWNALWLLAEIDLREHNFQKAEKEAARAVESGKGAANGAEFIEGEAQAELGRTADAVKTLQAFLRDAPADPNAPLARRLAGRLELAPPQQTPPGAFDIHMGPTATTSLQALPAATSAAPALASSAPALPFPDWEPPSVDQEKPAVADGVTCPAEEVLQKAGERVSELVDSVNRIEATEKITHEELSSLGHPIAVEKRKFDYQVSIAASSSGLLNVDEDRLGPGGRTFIDHISMFGLADLPLIFHPSLRRDFRMTCEGLGRWQGRATWLVYFRQRPDRPKQIRSYRLLDGSSYSVGLKGRAWIAADTYEIVRIEADLMTAIPQIGIGSEEDVIEYAPVPFHAKGVVLWLPASADIYYFYKHRPYHRHHAFTDYRLFSVSASQKIGLPAGAEEKNDQR